MEINISKKQNIMIASALLLKSAYLHNHYVSNNREVGQKA